jgi:NAD(P)-dependent dehydrogenase (short-subunit alcohol dehydrogenase family)
MSSVARHALITGAGTGIGAATATALARAGARVTLLGRERGGLEAHAATLPASAQATVVVADVTDRAALESAFGAAQRALGPIEVLVNNAGIGISAPLPHTDDELWTRTLATNLNGTFYAMRALVPAMAKAGWGRVINVASVAGLTGGPYIAAYVASKHGVVGLTRALSTEYAGRGVTINAVCPGFTQTPMLERSIAGIVEKTNRAPETAAAALLANSPLGRFVLPEEVADTIVWLARDGAAAITGQAIVIDGGQLAR